MMSRSYPHSPLRCSRRSRGINARIFSSSSTLTAGKAPGLQELCHSPSNDASLLCDRVCGMCVCVHLPTREVCV